MEHYDPDVALSDVHESRARTTAEGARPWPWSFVAALAAALIAIGATIDLDMIWLVALVLVALAAFAAPRRAQLLPSAVTGAYALVSAAVLVLAVVVNVLVQFLVRGQGWEAPNMWGGVGAGVVIVIVTRPAQAWAVKRAR